MLRQHMLRQRRLRQLTFRSVNPSLSSHNPAVAFVAAEVNEGLASQMARLWRDGVLIRDQT
jgi:hypothetical protein